MKNFRKESLILGSIVFVMLITLSGCCRLFPRFCPKPTPVPVWTHTLETGNGELNDIVHGNDLFVAVGEDGVHAAAWTSPYGFTWTKLPNDNLVFSKGRKISSIYYYDGFIAVGINLRGEPIVWYVGNNGNDWHLTEEPVFLDQNGSVIQDKTRILIKDVIVIPPDPTGSSDRKNIVVGAYYASGLESVGQAAIWEYIYASDSWRLIYLEPLNEVSDEVGGSIIYSIIKTSQYFIDNHGPAYIAVGSYDEFRGQPMKADQDASIWISDDGAGWSRLQTDYTVFASGQSSDLEKNQRLYTAMVQGIAIYVGGYDQSVTSSESMIWNSHDFGTTWQRLTDRGSENKPAFETDHTVYSLSSTNLPFKYGEVAVGSQISQGRNYMAFWRGATGFPRWKGGADILSQPGVLKQVASDGNVLVVVGKGIWTYAKPAD